MTFKIRVTGTKEVKALIKRIGKPLVNEIGESIVKTAEKHLKRTYARKVDTGALKRSIRSRWIKTKSAGFVTLGDDNTVRRSGKGASINYAKFIELGFRGHSFPVEDINPESIKLAGVGSKYVKVSGYGGLHGLSKSIEKTGKEMPSLFKKTFK